MLWARKLKHEAAKGLRRALGVSEAGPRFPLDFSDETIALCKRVKPYCMTSPERIAVLESAVRHLSRHGIEGDLVECGVARGGSCLAMALTLLSAGDTGRRLWLYDTFEGMPEPTDEDRGRFGNKAIKKYRKRLQDGRSTWVNRPLEETRAVMSSSGYPEERLVFVKGLVEETLLEQCPERIALLRLDTDFYTSTKAEMEHLYPRVVSGGVIIADDYYRWAGSRKAIDEYVSQHSLAIFWARIDDHGVIGIKP